MLLVGVRTKLDDPLCCHCTWAFPGKFDYTEDDKHLSVMHCQFSYCVTLVVCDSDFKFTWLFRAQALGFVWTQEKYGEKEIRKERKCV